MKPFQNNTIPLEAQYLYRRGLEMIDQKRTDTALIYFRQAVFIAPGFSKAYLELGNCLARLGRSEEAVIYRMKAARIDPIHCGTVADDATITAQDTAPAVPGQFLTRLIW
jgi:tetratricopeptide (TPR) repeat protein